jgi:H+-translocating NAD(P) transhydrogenase subunit alpha
MNLAVPKETLPGETRVALIPESVKKLTAAGFKISVESGAGVLSHYPDDAYSQAGASISGSHDLLSRADIVLKVRPPAPNSSRHETDLLRPGSFLLASLFPTRNLDAVRRLARANITAFSTDTIPRVTRAQSMDTLSSMASLAGYKGALIAASELAKCAPMFMTAAGTIHPARIFVVGAGVAGLQAIATARRLGANIFATDVRPETREQIQSVGAKYVGIDLDASAGGGYARELSDSDKSRQRDLLARECAAADAVITTALIGGVLAPRLITADMVRRMKPGAVLVDLAADGGGNCELSIPGSTTMHSGVKVIAPLNLAATLPTHASMLWSRNLTSFLLAFWKDNTLNLDLADEILRGATITHQGRIIHEPTRKAAESPD